MENKQTNKQTNIAVDIVISTLEETGYNLIRNIASKTKI